MGSDRDKTGGAPPRALVIENYASAGLARLGPWLADAGLDLHVLRPHAGDALPDDLDGYVALVVLGGGQSVHDGIPWFADVERLLRKAVRAKVATLGICLGAQLLATALGGSVAPAAQGPEIGPRLVARRDAAERDALFSRVPLAPDVIQWHVDEVTELPAGAVLLAASPRCPHQAFRVGEAAWAVQFHIECDAATVATWAANDADLLDEIGYDADEVVARCAAVMDDLTEVWQPFAARFAAVARGEIGRSGIEQLPLLGQ